MPRVQWVQFLEACTYPQDVVNTIADNLWNQRQRTVSVGFELPEAGVSSRIFDHF